MVNLRVIIFDVDHGFCSFIRSPAGYVMIIDCGKKDNFSPIKYIVDNELKHTVNYRGYKAAVFIVSHPHEDHILDIDNMVKYLKPSNLACNRYNWDDIKQGEGDYSALDSYIEFQKKYHNAVPDPILGMDYEMEFGLSVDISKKINEDKYINNSSIPAMISYKGWKIFYPGDVEEDGWNYLLKNNKEYCKYLRETDFYITSHHGHSSGYCKEIYDIMGKPYVNIVSAQSKDESVEPLYSTDNCAKGIKLNNKKRYMLSTRNDGSIFIEVDDDGKCNYKVKKLKDNL